MVPDNLVASTWRMRAVERTNFSGRSLAVAALAARAPLHHDRGRRHGRGPGKHDSISPAGVERLPRAAVGASAVRDRLAKELSRVDAIQSL